MICLASKRVRLHAVAWALAAALVAVGGCATQQVAPTGPATTVSITEGAFHPAAVNVRTGETVRWDNNSTSVQIVAATAFRSGGIAPGTSFSHTFTAPGTYRYTGASPTPVGMVVVAP